MGEGRRYSRSTIEDRLLRQWRLLATEERPLPSGARADAGVICFGVWRDGLRGAARERTIEQLNAPRWRRDRTHPSVHLTLYLRWAEERLGHRAASRVAALDIGRHIQSFV